MVDTIAEVNNVIQVCIENASLLANTFQFFWYMGYIQIIIITIIILDSSYDCKNSAQSFQVG